jgi:hypothetical protein
MRMTEYGNVEVPVLIGVGISGFGKIEKWVIGKGIFIMREKYASCKPFL